MGSRLHVRLGIEALEPRRVLSFIWDGNPNDIPDGGELRRSMSATFSNPEVIQDIEVYVNIAHARLSDLGVAIIGPNGTRIDLVLARQLNGTSISASFNDAAVASVGSGIAPYQGRFAPSESLGSFLGLRFLGNWTLVVTDTSPGMAGTLNSWSVKVNEPAPELTVHDARLVDIATDAVVPTALPGDVVGVDAGWFFRDVRSYTTGLPFTVRVGIDGDWRDHEFKGYGIEGTWSNGMLFRDWVATLGAHKVEVLLDPENRVWELDETDNYLSFEFEVRQLPRASRLVDITTDTSYDYPHTLLHTDDAFFFLMSDGDRYSGSEVWRSDGTPTGTYRIHRALGGTIKELTAVGKTLYFTGETYVWGNQLWISDGTEAGTQPFNQQIYNAAPSELTPFQDALIYARLDPDGNGRSLWRTNGTAQGTTLLVENLLGISRLTQVGNYLYFVGTDVAHGAELWRTDGTPQGTRLVADVAPGPTSSSPDHLVRIGAELFFTANTAAYGRELWASDGTGARLVADTRVGSESIGAFNSVVDLHGTAFFTGNYAHGTYDMELWRSDGTGAGTGEFLNINSSSSSMPSQLTVVGDSLYFRANDGMHGSELWVSKGTVESTEMVIDLAAGSNGSGPGGLVPMRGNVVFFADPNAATQLYASDGTPEGTGLVALLPLRRGKYTDLDTTEPTVVGDKLFFFWSDELTGRNLWSVTLGEFPSTRPDLHVAGASLFQAPPQFAWGDNVELNLNITNSGARMSMSPPSTAAIYLSTDARISTSDILLGGTKAGYLAIPPVGTAYESVFSRGSELQLPTTPPAGLPTSGVFYVGIVVDPSDAVDELNEINNANQGLLVDVFPIRIGAPQLVQIVTHGFRLPGLDVHSFLQPWVQEYPDILRELVRGTDLQYQSEIYSPTWDSTTGFLTAFVDEILYSAFAAITNLPEDSLLSSLVRWMIVGEEDTSYRNAVSAAEDIFATIQNTPSLQGRAYHLIGHSRGAAVNARLSYRLAEAGLNVVQYTALDGYSTDWPFPAGMLGDVSIVKEATASRKVNYRVELGLNQLLHSDVLMTMLLARLGIGVPSNDLEKALRDEIVDRVFLDDDSWKAPARADHGFEDKMIRGIGLDLSQHLNVHSLYFHSADNAPGEQYVLDSPLAGARRPGGEAEPPQNGTSFEWPIHGLIDGSFDETGNAWQQAVGLAGAHPWDNPLVAAWLAALQESKEVLRTRWNVTGGVGLFAEGTNWGVELTEGTDTEISQIVELDAQATSLTLDLEVLAARPGAALQVRFGDSLLQEVPLSAAAPMHQITIPLTAVAGTVGTLTLRLMGDSPTPARVRIDNLNIQTPLSIDTVLVSPRSAQPADAVRLEVPQTAVDSSTAQSVSFYVETNGQPGLQDGMQADRLLGVDDVASDGWTIVVPGGSWLPGAYVVYAVAHDTGGATGLPGMTSFSVRFGEFEWQNPVERLDVDADGFITPLDALIVINDLNRVGPRLLPEASYLTSAPPWFVDADGDGYVSSLDPLLIINALNARPLDGGEAEYPGLEFDIECIPSHSIRAPRVRALDLLLASDDVGFADESNVSPFDRPTRASRGR